MELTVWQSQWLIWCMIAFVPFQVYDLYKKTDRKWHDYLWPAFMILFVLYYAYCNIFGNYDAHGITVPGGELFIYIVFGMGGLFLISDVITEKTKRSYLNAGLFAIAIIIYFILKVYN